MTDQEIKIREMEERMPEDAEATTEEVKAEAPAEEVKDASAEDTKTEE